MVIRCFRTLSFAPDLISQLGADLLAIGCDKSLPKASIYPDNLAFCPKFGALLLEDQFDPYSALVHSETNRRAGLSAVAPKAIHMRCLVDRNRDLRHSRSEAQTQVKRRPAARPCPHSRRRDKRVKREASNRYFFFCAL
jgi:hypothetical protein